MPLRNAADEERDGVMLKSYQVNRSTSSGIHPWVSEIETKIIRGEACFQAAIKLDKNGFKPDIILGHPGWGESMFLKQVWPNAKLLLYAEFYYHTEGADIGFDPEFYSHEPGDDCRVKLKNVNALFQFESAAAGISPTYWQASTFPERIRNMLSVIHDGIDTEILVPNAHATLTLNSSIRLTVNDEIITFVNRNLEPTRGYHIFMRALPELLSRHPKARILIVGGDGVSYGAAAETGTTWKDTFANEVRPSISDEDWARVHFLGKIPYHYFVTLLQLSTVHVYLTYPFVLSWSMLEAMSVGCAIVASDTKPVREAILHDETGRLVDFFDVSGFVNQISELLNDPDTRARLGAGARQFARDNYDLKSICLPRQLAWVESFS